MPVPSAVTDLSATAASNSPASTESPGDGDDYLRALSAFIKQSYDGTLTNLFRVNSSGVPYGTAIHNPSGTLTGTTNQLICSGTYTPTLTNNTNITTSTANANTRWTRVGNVVHVAGSVAITATGATTTTTLYISLPIAANFSSVTQLSGTAARTNGGATIVAAHISAEITSDVAQLTFHNDSDTGSARNWHFTFTYTVV